MGNLQGLPVFIRDKVGLHQEAIDQSEYHGKHSYSQHTYGVKIKIKEEVHIYPKYLNRPYHRLEQIHLSWSTVEIFSSSVLLFPLDHQISDVLVCSPSGHHDVSPLVCTARRRWMQPVDIHLRSGVFGLTDWEAEMTLPRWLSFFNWIKYNMYIIYRANCSKLC